MLDDVDNYIPIMTSEAGLCLTADNWREARINTMTFYLDSLLLKPGYEFLHKIPDVAQFIGWSGNTILNASRCVPGKDGIFVLTSPYDGSKMKLSCLQLLETITHIQPDAAILPPKILQDFPDFWSNWKETIIPFFAVEDLLKQDVQAIHGVYFKRDDGLSHSAFLEQIKKWTLLPRYVIGPCPLDLMSDLKKEGVIGIESDEPAAMALQGEVYSNKTTIQLTDPLTATQFETIENGCKCPTCSQNFTKAYLHHLYLHTPLLCQRFLIQHNACFAQNYIGN